MAFWPVQSEQYACYATVSSRICLGEVSSNVQVRAGKLTCSILCKKMMLEKKNIFLLACLLLAYRIKKIQDRQLDIIILNSTEKSYAGLMKS